METNYNSVVVVLNLDTDGFQYYTLPNNDFACDLQWVGSSSFIGLSMTDSAWRLGAIYCANRESRVFQMDEHGHRKTKTILMFKKCKSNKFQKFLPC